MTSHRSDHPQPRPTATRRRGDVSSPNTPVDDFDPTHVRTAFFRIKRRLRRAIGSEFPLNDPAYPHMHGLKRKYLAGLRKLHSLRMRPALQAAACDEHLRAYSTRAMLALCALKKKRSALLLRRTHEIELMARQMALAQRATPTFTTIDSDGDKSRTVYSYGPVDYARQLGLSDIITIMGPSPYNDYASIGSGGIGAQIRHVHDLIASGHNCFLTADVRQVFPSVRPHDVKALINLPEWALDHILFSEDEQRGLPTNVTTTTTRPNASRGLPQGSVCSGSAWSMVAGSILRPLAGERWDISHYVDNVLAGARSRPELEHFQSRLEEELFSASSGRLRLHCCQIVDLREQPLDLLGNWISLQPERRAWTRPSPAGWNKARDRCRDLMAQLIATDPMADAEDLLDRVEVYLSRWAASHSEWKPADPDLKWRMYTELASTVWQEFCWEYDVPLPDPF